MNHKLRYEVEVLGQHVDAATPVPDSVDTALDQVIAVADLADMQPGDGKLELLATIKTKIGAFPIKLPIKITLWSE